MPFYPLETIQTSIGITLSELKENLHEDTL